MCEHNINVHALNEIKSDIIRHSPYPNLVNIIAVTKNFNISAIDSATTNNITHIGENRVQEYIKKIQNFPELEQKIESHLIGKLQTNKVNKAVGIFDFIHTVDSVRLAIKIDSRAHQIGITQPIFIQLNIGNDPNKTGFKQTELYEAAEKIQTLNNIHLTGIMTILPFGLENQQNQHYFYETRKIKESIQQKISPTCKFLSMGMSSDYIEALKEGATHIRVGTKLYGTRK